MKVALSTLALSAFLSASLGGCVDDPAASPRVTVEKLDVANGCFAACPSSELPDAALPLDARCTSKASSCDLAGGADLLRVVVDYGDLAFAADDAIPAPTLTLTLDDEDSPAPGGITAPPRAAGRAYFVASFPAPSRAAQSMRVTARGAEGFVASVGGLRVQSPAIGVEVAQCAGGAGCVKEADVGSAILTIRAPIATDPPTARLTSTLNGVPLLQTAIVDLTPEGPISRSGFAFLTVPPGNQLGGGQNDVWSIQTLVGETVVRSEIQLVPPTIAVTLPICAGGGPQLCGVKAGSSVLVRVTAPHDINATQATFTYDLDGVPSGLSFLHALDLEDVLTRSAEVVIPTPPQPDSIWVVTARIGKYSAQAQAVTLSP